VAFTLAGHHPRDIARFLAGRGIYVRDGHHYAWEIHKTLGLDGSGGSVRVSLAHYNSRDEVERLGSALDELTGG
jgi:selenocysteine lyase/cysteine desulfurase